MKSVDEIAENVFRARDAYDARERKKKIVLRSVLIPAGTVAAAGVAVLLIPGALRPVNRTTKMTQTVYQMDAASVTLAETGAFSEEIEAEEAGVMIAVEDCEEDAEEMPVMEEAVTEAAPEIEAVYEEDGREPVAAETACKEEEAESIPEETAALPEVFDFVDAWVEDDTIFMALTNLLPEDVVVLPSDILLRYENENGEYEDVPYMEDAGLTEVTCGAKDAYVSEIPLSAFRIPGAGHYMISVFGAEKEIDIP